MVIKSASKLPPPPMISPRNSSFEDLKAIHSKLQNHLRHFLSTLGESVDIFHGAVILVSLHGHGDMQCLVSVGISRERLTALCDFTGHFFTTPKPPQSVAGHGAARKKTICFSNLDRDDKEGLYKTLPGSQGGKDKGILCVPVLEERGGAVVCRAVVSITSKKANVFTRHHEELAEQFVTRHRSLILDCIYRSFDINKEHEYNNRPVERLNNPSSPEIPVDPLEQAVRECIAEFRSKDRGAYLSRPTKAEQLLLELLRKPGYFIDFDTLRAFFEDTSDPDHTRDVFIGRLNTKLERFGCKLERPRGYHLVPISPSGSDNS